MLLVSVDVLKSGMILARPVYRYDDGKILLRANIELKSFYIKRLKEMRYPYVYIRESGDDEEDQQAEIEPIKQETRVKAGAIFRETVQVMQKNNNFNLQGLKKVVGEMIDQIFHNNDVVYNMVDIRSHDSYTFAHSVNVCTISLLLGSALNFSRNDLESLGVGALLHDIGKIFVDSQILNKPSKLAPEEFEMVKKHPRDGYELLKEKVYLNFSSSHVAFQHHEREDGSGYPRGLTGERIHRFAKIVSVVDVYDAMTSERVYRKAIPSHIVLAEIKAQAEKKFDQTVVDSLEKIVAPYPVGSVLLLNNGESVVVRKVTRSECQVRVNTGPREGETFDLYRAHGLSVVRYLS